LLDEIADEPIDLIVLPEMALIGYRFDNREDIAPYTESVPQNIGTLIDNLENDNQEEAKVNGACTFTWALKVSKRFSPAWVAVGFAERDTNDNYFNSAVVISHSQRICHVIRKTLHFTDDKLWATLESSVSGREYNY